MAERFGKGTVDRVGGIWVLHLAGTSFERGLQHGTLMRYRVRDTIDFYRSLPDSFLSRVSPKNTGSLKTLNRLKRAMVRQFAGSGDSDAVDELRGLAVGLGLQVEDLAEVLLLPDVLGCAGSLSRKRRRFSLPVLSGMGGTSAIGETSNGELVFGRNLNFWGAGYWDLNPSVIFHHPDHGKAFCSVTTAGLPTGGITSINEDGLALAVHQCGSLDADPRGTPLIDIAHTIARAAATVEEAIGIASQFKATGGCCVVLAGGSPSKAAVLEMSAARQVTRWLADKTLVATNSFLDGELSSRGLHPNCSSVIADKAITQRAAVLASTGRVTPSRMAGIVGDHYDALAGRDRSSGFSISSIMNLSSAVFSLPQKRFWVSESPAPASRGGFVGFDLDSELGRGRSNVGRLEGGRPPRINITRAQERYLDAYKRYIDTGDLNLVLNMLGECSSLDPQEPTFPLMEGVVRCMLGNLRGALSATDRALELEQVESKKAVTLTWKARILDLMDHREQSSKIYSELAENDAIPPAMIEASRRCLRKPFTEKRLEDVVIDFANGDTLE